MKKLKKFLAVLLSVLIATTGLIACGGGGGGDVDLDEDGNVIPGSGGGVTNITFWGTGDDTEQAVFTNIVNEFNKKYEGSIKVWYELKSDGDYATTAQQTLRKSTASVDVLYVKEPDFKLFAEQGYLEPLDSYLANSSEVVINDMWETSMSRYRYDTSTQ